MKNRLWGLILVVLGVLVLLQAAGVFDFGLAFWPVVLLLLGFAILWESIGHGFFSWIMLGLGLWVGGIGLFGILSNAGITGVSGSDVARFGWPLVLVAVGLSLLVGDHNRFPGKIWLGAKDRQDGKASSSHRRNLGDLYHGRAPWVMDEDMEFHHGMGDVVIDFSTAQIKPGTHSVFIKTGIGEVTIRVPDGINLDIEASVGLGELELFGEKRSGIGNLALKRKVNVVGAEATLQIEARLGIGDLTVLHIPSVAGAAK